jgi:hypothetical protein
MMTSITQHTPAAVTLNVMKGIDGIHWVENLKSDFSGTMILVNGVVIGFSKNPIAVHAALRNAKYTFQLHPHTSVAWNISRNCISVESDSGQFAVRYFV